MALNAPMAFAQGVIQSITSTQQSGADVVRIEMSEPLAAVPAGFAIQQPARIAIDLPGVSNGMGRPSVEINQGNLRSVNVAQAGDRTRLGAQPQAGRDLPRADRRQGAVDRGRQQLVRPPRSPRPPRRPPELHLLHGPGGGTDHLRPEPEPRPAIAA